MTVSIISWLRSKIHLQPEVNLGIKRFCVSIANDVILDGYVESCDLI